MVVETGWEDGIELDGTEVDGMWGGSLTDVKEIRSLIPPSKNVKLQIAGYMIFGKYENGDDRNWKQIMLKFRVVDGINVGGEIKYKGTVVSQTLPYFANPGYYDYTKPFFKGGQFLIPLIQVVKATGIDSPTLIKGGLTDENAEQIGKAADGKMLIGSIMQTKATVKDPETGKYVESGDLVNEVKFFKAVPDSALV
jgi:hypothetical protein